MMSFSGMYLIVITKKKKVGDLLGHAVWKAVDFDIISYKKTMLHLTDNQVGSRRTAASHYTLSLFCYVCFGPLCEVEGSSINKAYMITQSDLIASVFP